MKIVLLPGLDGTGILFEPFLKCLETDIKVEVIKLPESKNQAHKELALSIAERLSSDELIILAESYSGRIAYELARSNNLKIVQIIFFAGFLSRPSFLSKFSKLLPISLIQSRYVPRSLVGKILYGYYSSEYLLDLFYKAIKHAKPCIVEARLREVSLLVPPSAKINIPCTYVRALDDNLVSANVIGVFKEYCKNLDIKEIEGTHFVLQTNPLACWQIVNEKIIT